MGTFEIIDGNVTKPIGIGLKLIVHCVNDQKIMGSGVARSLYEVWPQVKHHYLTWVETLSTPDFKLGEIQIVQCENDISVVNLIGQHMVGVDENGNPPVRYDAVINGFRNLIKFIRNMKIIGNKDISIHIPYKFCCDRAGGDWEIIEKIIKNELCSKDISVTIYAL